MNPQHTPAAVLSVQIQRAQLLPFQIEICGYWHKIPNNELMTKKRFLARLRNSMQFEYDQEFKRFYELAIETPFKSVMRKDLRVTVNF